MQNPDQNGACAFNGVSPKKMEYPALLIGCSKKNMAVRIIFATVLM